jgi:hypothetical protein
MPREDDPERTSRRTQLRADALADKAERAKAGGHDPAKYDGKTAEELEQLSYDKQDAPRAERLAIRVALDRALARRSLDAKLANLSEDERSVLIQADTLRARANAQASRT